MPSSACVASDSRKCAMSARILITPPRSRSLVVIVWLLVWLGPVVNYFHFNARAVRGDYPPEADSIGIPIMTHALLFFPFELFALRGLDFYRGGLSLWCFSNRKKFFAALSTIASIYPFGLWCAFMTLDGLSAGFYGTSLFYILRLYAFLLLRVGLMQAYDQPNEDDDDV